MSENIKKRSRIWELDFFRGFSIIIMIIFHTLFSMKEIYGYHVVYATGPIFYLGRVAVTLFMLIAGISCTLTHSNLKRGLKVLIIALLLTLITYLFSPKLIIWFGILHFFAVCMLLSPILLKLNNIVLTIGALIIFSANTWVAYTKVSTGFLFPIGLTTQNFSSSDYYPLIPWMGIFLIGLVLGKTLYKSRQSIFPFSIRNNPINFIGKHTLVIYLIHQPIIIGILELIHRLKR